MELRLIIQADKTYEIIESVGITYPAEGVELFEGTQEEIDLKIEQDGLELNID